jgi:hypothetical protein
VDQIHGTYEKIGNADEEEVIVIKKSTRVPGNHKNTTGDNNRENFGKAMEEEVIVEAGQI